MPQRLHGALVERAAAHRALRGGEESLRAELARAYYHHTGRIANQAALANAMLLLEGESRAVEQERLHLRVAKHGKEIVLDLGDVAGQALVVSPEGWRIESRSPVLFRRTGLTMPLPEPTRSGSLERLWELSNFAPRDQPLVLAWLCMALLPHLECPIVLLGGEAGVGKSTAAAAVAQLIDPSSAPLRSAPTRRDDWPTQASGSRVVALDNISRIEEWLSDALCRAVTGEGVVKRRLYTDSSLSVLSFSRAVILTSIDPGALRGDLGERLVMFELEHIRADKRQQRSELRESLESEAPGILGALLDLLSAVLRRLPAVELPEMGRMADFERVLAAVDAELGTQGLREYREQGKRIAQDVVESDAVAEAIVALVPRLRGREWVGTAGKLLRFLEPIPVPGAWPPRDWPNAPRAMAGRLRRIRGALESVGVQLVPPGQTDRPRHYRLRRAPSGDEEAGTVETVAPTDGLAGDTPERHPPPTVIPTKSKDRESDRRAETASQDLREDHSGRSDGLDGRRSPTSGDPSLGRRFAAEGSDSDEGPPVPAGRVEPPAGGGQGAPGTPEGWEIV